MLAGGLGCQGLATVISDHRLTFGRLQVYIDSDDQWLGRYRAAKAWYYCPVPCLVFRWTRRIDVDQVAPSGPPRRPQSDDRGEVAGTDTVEAQEGTQPCPHQERCPSCRCVLDAGHHGDHDVHCGNGSRDV
jgi:hypothetical protein